MNLLLAALWLGFASPAGPGGAGTDGPAGGSARAEQRAIVFMLGEGQPRARAVASAIENQIADLDARLEIEPLPPSTELGPRLQAARRLAAAHHAVGVFWLEVDQEGALLLHLVDANAERMLVRRVEPSPESDTAAVQTVAVIARGFTSALLEGRSIGLYRVEVETQPASDDELPPLGARSRTGKRGRGRGRLRMGAAYYGAHVASESEWVWQSGVAASLAWQWPIGVYAGLGYDATQRFTTVTASEIAMNTISSEIRRNPASAIGGYQHAWPQHRLALDGELRFIVDVNTVSNDALVDGSIVSEQSVSPFLLLSPRAALHFRPRSYFSAHLTLGAEVLLMGDKFSAEFYDASGGDPVDSQTYLTPAVFRPLALAGVVFYL